MVVVRTVYCDSLLTILAEIKSGRIVMPLD